MTATFQPLDATLEARTVTGKSQILQRSIPNPTAVINAGQVVIFSTQNDAEGLGPVDI